MALDTDRRHPLAAARPLLRRATLARRLLSATCAVLLLGAQTTVAASQAPRDTLPPILTDSLLSAFKFWFIGPANMSGRVTAIAVPDTAGHKTIYVGTASGGVWKTTNAGTTWKPIFDNEGSASIGDLVVAPGNHRVVWVGTGERNSLRSNAWGDGVYKSTDGGTTWKHMGLEETREIGRIVIHPTDTSVVYVAALGHLWGPNPERGVYKTTDGGQTWERILFVDDTTGFVDLKMDPSNPNVLYAASWHRIRWGGGRMEGAGAGSAIWKTTDGGRTWKRLTDPALNNGLPTEQLGRIGLAISPRNPRIVYAVIQVAHSSRNPRVSPFGGLFRSEDAGATWTRVNDLSAVPDYYYNEVWIDPNDDERLFLAGVSLDHSEDGGRSFAPLRMEKVHVDHHTLWIDPTDSDHMVLGNDGGVYITFDGGETWAHQIIPVGQFYEVSVDTTKVPYHVCGGLQDNGIWCGPSRTREEVGITDADWYRVHGGDGFHSAVAPDSPNIRYGESQFGNLTRLDVEAWKFTPLQPQAEDAGAESGYAFRWDWNTPFIISRHEPSVLYLGGNHFFKLAQRGERWEILGPDMTRANRFAPEPEVGHTAYHSLHSLAESAVDARVLWAGSNDGLLWVSTDGGASWRNVTENIPQERARRCWVAEIEPSHFDRLAAYVVYDCHRRDDYRPYVFKTTDGGESWTEITGNLPEDGGSYVIREDPVNPKLLFVGTERGLWVSNQGGGRWVRLKNNLPTVAVRDMDIVARYRELVVGTFGRSIWILDIAPLEELTDSVLAADAHLFQVKPAHQYRRRDTYGATGQQFFATPNPPYGAVITYYLRADQGKDVTLTIRRAPAEAAGAGGRDPSHRPGGTQVGGAPSRERATERTAAPEAEHPEGRRDTVQTLTGSGRPGIHQVVWDLTSKEPRPRELGGPIDREELQRVLPGEYLAELKVGEKTLRQTIRVEDGWVERTPGRVR